MSGPEGTPPSKQEAPPITADPSYRKTKETWTSNGCQPENDFFDNLERLAEDVKAGLMDDTERLMREKNARFMMEAGQLSPYLYELIRKAVRVDKCGNLEKI